MKWPKRCLSLLVALSMVLPLFPILAFRQSKASAAGKAEGWLETPVQTPSGTQYDARVKYEVLIAGGTSETGGTDTRSAVIRFTLENPGEEPVSFHYTAVSGSADTSRHLTGTFSGTVNLSQAEPVTDVVIDIAPFADNPGKYGLPDNSDAFWTGRRVFYLCCDDIRNALFDGDRDSLTIPVPVESEFDYLAVYERAVNTGLIDLDAIDGASSPGVYPIPAGGALTLTAEIFGDVRKMLDAGVFSHIRLPEGYFQHDGSAEGSVIYRMAVSRLPDGSDAIEVFQQSVVLTESGQTPFYSEFFPQEQPVSDVNLGPSCEGNGIFRGLDFTFDYSEVTGAVDTCFFDAEGQYVRRQVSFSDEAAPTVRQIYITAPLIHCGDRIPVVINFSEPVYTDEIVFEVGGQTLCPVEGSGTISDAVSFLYTVGDEHLDAGEIIVNVNGITGAVDLSGKEQEGPESGSAWGPPLSFDPDNPERTLLYCAEPSVTLDQGTSCTAEATVSIPLKRSANLSNWLVDSSRLGDGSVSTAIKARAISAAGIVDIPLTVETDAISATGLTGSFTAPENNTGQNQLYALEIHLDGDGDGSFSVVYGLATVYVVPPLIIIDDETDLALDYANWPPGDSVFADTGRSLSLGYILSVDATWQGPDYFTWSSGNEEIAEIDAFGNITLTGVPGTVPFALTVTNPLSDDAIRFESRTLTVREAEGAYLYVPDALKNLDSLRGNAAKVSFSSNLAYRNDTFGGAGTETAYTFALYEAYYDGDVMKKGSQLSVWTISSTAASPVTSFTVPGELLTDTTAKGRFGYILEVNAQDLQSGVTCADEANIRVRALPAVAALVRAGNSFLTDSMDSFGLSFDIKNREIGTEFLLTVTKNSQSEPVLSVTGPEYIGQTLTVDIDSVDGGRLLDVYTISLKAKNGSDEVWSYDSYFVYVYNAHAMKLLLNGFPAPGTLTMKSNFRDGEVLYGTDLLMTSRWGLGLAELVSVDGKAYPWSAIADRVIWRVDGESVSLWYGSGSSARRIGDDHNPVLLPGTVLVLRGDGAGSSVVTAAHTLTGMTASMDVTVKPLNDKLYLFRTYPPVPCEVVYTNGENVEKTLSAPSGEVGVYEESGIAGDVVVYPTGESEAVYDFAVLKHGELMANQRSSGTFDLYPMNTVKLPRLNYNASLQLLDETSGKAYVGDIVVRGGVYLNGVYQQATTINDKRGDADQTVSQELSPDGAGRYHLAFRPADFTDKLRASDELQYVIEVGFPDNSHLTRYLKVENDAIRNAKSSPLGVSLSAGIRALDASAIQNQAVVLSETFTVDGEERPMFELLYLEEIPESAILELTAMIPGDSDLFYRLHMRDFSGSSGVADVVHAYPFSDTLTLHFSLDVRSALWYAVEENRVKPGERIDFYPVIRSTDGRYEVRLSKPIRVLNLMGIPKMSSLRYGETDYTEILGLITDMSSSSGNLTFSDDDGAVKDALDFLTDYATYSASMGLEVQATDDPLVYKGIIRFAAGSYSKDNPSGVFVGEGESRQFNFLPGPSDIKAMKKGTFLENAKKEMNTRGYKSYGGGAYLECEVYYSIEEQEWKVRLLTGDVYLGGGGGYQRHYNGWIAFVPVTATFKTSLTAELGLTILRSPVRDFTAYIPRLRPVFSIYGFGGFGRDYEVVALKAGVYGYAEHEQLYLWYSDSDGQKADGQRLKISGEVGVEYAIKLLFAELKGKYVLTRASKSWKYNDFDYINNKIPTGLRFASLFSLDDSEGDYMLVLVPLEESVSYEDRSYLENYDRSWGFTSSGSTSSGARLSALSSGAELTDIWTNAYPYAAPSVSDDGELMAYLSDMDSEELRDTAACFAIKDGTGAFPEGSEIAPSDYPDSGLSLSGTADGAFAVWVRSFTGVGGEDGGEATAEDAVNALAAAEIMAGIYDGDAFTATQLTDNDNPDLSPVTATFGNKAVAAWRSVTLGALDNPLDFTSDYIMYSVYGGSDWNEAKCLYDGSVDQVRTLSAAALPDGSFAIVYQISERDGDSEIICAVLDSAGEIVRTLRLTDNGTSDENPQVTTAEFPDGAHRFVVGWSATTESGESIARVAAVNADGTLHPDFALELSDSTGVSSFSSFRFAKGADSIEDLSLIWSEPGDADGDGTYEETIFGAKVLAMSDGSASLYGKRKLLALDEGRTVDSLDARVDPATGEVHFAMLLSELNGSATLSTAVAGYQNELTLEDPYFEYEDLLPGLEMPVLFTVTNDGVEPITEVTIVLGGETYDFEDEAIVPSETKSFLISYPVPDTLADVNYAVTAQFGSAGGTGGTSERSGVLKFGLPDVGIYQIDRTKETGRERGFRVLLHNNAHADLKEGRHSVKLEVWDAPDFKIGSPLKTLTISGGDLEVLNDSLLSIDVNLTEADLRGLLDDDGEIPAGGAWLFFRVTLWEAGVGLEDVETEDADSSNDMDYVKVQSLIEKKGAAVSLASVSQTVDGRTRVQVEAFNNSMNAVSDGNLIVTLRDADGNVLETLETYDPANPGSLLSIAGEDTETATFLFGRAGYTADVTFARVSDGGTDPGGDDTGSDEPSDDDDYFAVLSIGDVKRADLGVRLAGGRAVVSLGYLARDVFSGDSDATLTVPAISGVSGYMLEAPADAMAGPNTGAVLRVFTHLGSIHIPSGVLAGTAGLEGKTARMVIASGDKTKLSDDNRAAVGDRPALSLVLTVEGEPVDRTSPDAPVSLRIPYAPTSEEQGNLESIVIWHIDDSWQAPAAPSVVSVVVPNGRYDPVTGTVTFTAAELGDYAITYNPVSFLDVPVDAWYKKAVRFIAARGISDGTGNGEYSPEAILTRGQFIVLVMRAYGIDPEDNPTDNFSDAGDTYYTGYLAAAKRLGISSGVGDNRYAPENAITRQEMFTLLYNALRVVGRLPDGDSGRVMADFSDGDKVSHYAREAVAYLVEAGVVSGDNNMLLPMTTATRAEMAQVLYNLLAK